MADLSAHFSDQAYPPHILVVDDDTRLRSLLKRYLTKNNFMVSTASDAASARRQLKSLQFDLLIVDIMMPGETGLELVSDLRCTSNVPVLFLTAMGEADDRIKGLEYGADDYMTKPFEPRELLLRVHSILRRIPPADDETNLELRFGTCRYSVARHELYRNGDLVRLTTAEADLLKILSRQAGSPVSRYDLAPSNSGANPRTIDVQITRLRRKIEDDPRQPRYLQTVRGTGYLLRTD